MNILPLSTYRKHQEQHSQHHPYSRIVSIRPTDVHLYHPSYVYHPSMYRSYSTPYFYHPYYGYGYNPYYNGGGMNNLLMYYLLYNHTTNHYDTIKGSSKEDLEANVKNNTEDWSDQNADDSYSLFYWVMGSIIVLCIIGLIVYRRN